MLRSLLLFIFAAVVVFADQARDEAQVKEARQLAAGGLSSSIVRTMFQSLKTNSPIGFPTAVDSNVKLRVVPVGDFYGSSQFKAAIWSPFRDAGSLFSSVSKVYELYNVLSADSGSTVNGRVLFLYDMLVTINSAIPTQLSRTVNVTVQGTARIASGKITHMYFNILNLGETIKPNYNAYTTESQAYIAFICNNEKNRCPSSIFNGDNIYWFYADCVASLTLGLKQIGHWTTIGREDSYVCRAWYSSIMGGYQDFCQSVRTVSNSYCQDELYDVQWPNVADFYNLAPASIPKIRNHSQFPPFQLQAGTATTCDATCQALNVQTVERLYSNTLWPRAFEIALDPSSFDALFSSDIVGRITPVGTFDGLLLNQEYFSGLTASNFSSASSGFILMNQATADFKVIAHYIIQLDAHANTPVTPIPISATNMSEVIVFQFDNYGRIISYDGDLSELGAAQDPSSILKRSPYFVNYPIIGDIAALLAADLGLLTSATISGICQAAMGYCPQAMDPAGYYASNDDCVSYLTNTKYGSWDDVADHNTVTCRLLHTLLVPLRPDVHCPHIGKTGGGVCVTNTMTWWYGWQFDGSVPQVVASGNDLAVASSSTSSDVGLIVGLTVTLGVCALLIVGAFAYRRYKGRSYSTGGGGAQNQQEPDVEVVNQQTVQERRMTPSDGGRLPASDGGDLKKHSNLSQV